MNTEKKKQFIINTIFWAIIICIVLLIMKYLLPTLIPFIIAFLVASMLQFPVKKLSGTDLKWNRVITIIVGIIFFGLVFLGIAYLGIRIFKLFLDFLEVVPGMYQNDILPFLNNFLDTLRQRIAFADMEIALRIDSVMENLLKTVGNFISSFSLNAVGGLTSGLAGIPGLIIKLIICIVSCFFFMLDYDKIMGFLNSLIPKAYRTKADTVKTYVKSTLLVYIRSYFFLFCLTCIELAVGFQILGIPYGAIWGALIGVFDILPILGTGGILLPWVVILLVMGNIPLGIGIFVLYLVITIIRNTLEPKMVGKQIGLHPLATLISLYVGLKVLGILGMFIFPVSLAILSSMNRDMKEKAEEKLEEKGLS